MSGASLSCDPDLAFSNLCGWIQGFDSTHIAGPVIQRVLGPVIVFGLILFTGRLLRRFLERAIDRAGGDRQVRVLVHNVVLVAVWILAVISALIEAGLNPSFLLTFGGISTLAVGLAFQDLLRNILAGIFILVERPFRIGDFIQIQDLSGTVQTIKLRTTALRTPDGLLAVVPNLTAFNETVINTSAFDKRQFTITVHVDPSSDINAALKHLRREVDGTKSLTAQPAPSLQPHLNPDGVNRIDVKYWLDQRAYDPDEVMADLSGRLWAAVAPVSAA